MRHWLAVIRSSLRYGVSLVHDMQLSLFSNSSLRKLIKDDDDDTILAEMSYGRQRSTDAISIDESHAYCSACFPPPIGI